MHIIPPNRHDHSYGYKDLHNNDKVRGTLYIKVYIKIFTDLPEVASFPPKDKQLQNSVTMHTNCCNPIWPTIVPKLSKNWSITKGSKSNSMELSAGSAQ